MTERIKQELSDARAEIERLREAVRELVGAGNEAADKLHVLRCNSRDQLDREAADKAGAMWSGALAKSREVL